jgi:DNA-binding NtrC family response regulator
MALETGTTLSLPVLTPFIAADPSGADHASGEDGEDDDDYASAMARFETAYLKELLRRHQGNVEAAAREAGMNMATIYRKLKKYDLRRDEAT